MILFLVLAAAFLSAGYKLLANLRTDFVQLYRSIKWKVIGITFGGTFAMLFRAGVSTVFVFSPHVFDDFKEASLMANSASYPVFLVMFLLFAEILPILCFLVFLILSINTTGFP